MATESEVADTGGSTATMVPIVRTQVRALVMDMKGMVLRGTGKMSLMMGVKSVLQGKQRN